MQLDPYTCVDHLRETVEYLITADPTDAYATRAAAVELLMRTAASATLLLHQSFSNTERITILKLLSDIGALVYAMSESDDTQASQPAQITLLDRARASLAPVSTQPRRRGRPRHAT